MAKAKNIVKMESTEGTGYFITTFKNSRNKPEKMEFMRYDPVVRKHVLFKEKKVK